MTLELAWNVPCSKQSRDVSFYGENATLYSAWAHDGANEQMYPRDAMLYSGEDAFESVILGEAITLLKSDSGTWYFKQYDEMILQTYDRFWREAPRDWIEFSHELNNSYMWYGTGDGVDGGLGNPPLIQLDPTIDQVYI